MHSSRTLLLNTTYEPLRVISWQRAITMVYLDKVEIVRSYDRVLRSVSVRIQTPAVVRLTTFVRRHRVRISFSRRNVFLRDGHRCQYCGRHYTTRELTLDHVVPRVQGGEHTWENLVCACVRCNARKGGRTPEQARMKLIRAPIKPKRSPLISIRLGHDKYDSR